ncbi:MAG: hypothetical protein K2Y21_06630 [Phycisphaerales bacterium]|nr:hypothetical protein [Phycisphaerales bacterium]
MRSVLLGICGAIACASGSAVAAFEANVADGLVTNPGNLTRFTELDPNLFAITPGDTYAAAVLGQSSAGAGFVTTAGRTTTFAYGSTTNHGTLIGSGATVRIGTAQTLIAPNVLRVVVAAFTTDSSNLWVNGITIGGQAMTLGRFDVGSNVLGSNGLLWDNLPGAISSVSIFSALWSPANGFVSPIATSTALTNARTLPEMGSAVVWNGVVGSSAIINEINMVFDITFVPTPGTAGLLAFGGLLAARRRR